MERQPGRDVESDKNQRAETKRRDPIQLAQKWPLCRTVIAGKGGSSPGWAVCRNSKTCYQWPLLVCLSAFSTCRCQAPGQHRLGCQQYGSEEKNSGYKTSFVRKKLEKLPSRIGGYVPGIVLGNLAARRSYQKVPVPMGLCGVGQFRVTWQWNGCHGGSRKSLRQQ